MTVGENLLFTPANGMNVYASDAGGGSQFTDSQLSMFIAALPGQTIDTFWLGEVGDYLLSAGAASTNAAWQLGSLQLLVMEVDHDPSKLVAPIFVTPNVTFTVTPSHGVPYPPNGIQFLASSSWQNGDIDVSANFDVAGALAAASVRGKATKLSLVFDNRLTVQSQPDTYAYISKKQLELYAGAQALPEPGTLALFGAGVLGLAWLGWRKKRHLRSRPAA